VTQEPRTLPQLLDRSVEAHASRTALITREERWSYRDLSERVDCLSRSLAARGVGKGSRIGLLMENGPDWIALAFAATGLGAVLVPISTFSKQDDLAYQLRHGDVGQLFLSARFLKNDYLSALRAIAPELEREAAAMLYAEALPALRRVVVRGAEELPAGCEAWQTFEAAGEGVPEAVVRGLREEVDPEDECYLLYTSGTTARPKGVVQVHDAVARNGWRIGDRLPGHRRRRRRLVLLPALLLGGLYQRHARHPLPRRCTDPAALLRAGPRSRADRTREGHHVAPLAAHPEGAHRASGLEDPGPLLASQGYGAL
jgi:fatty-acyl-CoA synthase